MSRPTNKLDLMGVGRVVLNEVLPAHQMATAKDDRIARREETVDTDPRRASLFRGVGVFMGYDNCDAVASWSGWQARERGYEGWAFSQDCNRISVLQFSALLPWRGLDSIADSVAETRERNGFHRGDVMAS